MPKGPKGQKRPADVIGNAVHVMKVLTAEADEGPAPATNRSKGGKVGGVKRAESLSAEERKQIAQKAAAARWGNKGE